MSAPTPALLAVRPRTALHATPPRSGVDRAELSLVCAYTPDGWSVQCSEHGEVLTASGGRPKGPGAAQLRLVSHLEEHHPGYTAQPEPLSCSTRPGSTDY